MESGIQYFIQTFICYNVFMIQIADIVFSRGDKVLLVQQRKQIAHGLWSYPGGRVEAGETLEQALRREVREELDAELLDYEYFDMYHMANDQGEIEINTFIGNFTGEIHLKEDELMAYGWFSLSEMQNMKDLRSATVFEQAKDVLTSK